MALQTAFGVLQVGVTFVQPLVTVMFRKVSSTCAIADGQLVRFDVATPVIVRVV